MVRVTYTGLGGREAAIDAFDDLRRYVLIIRAMQAKCWPLGPDDMALEIAVDGLETAAFHFTRRPLYYDMTRVAREHGRNYYEGLGDRQACVEAFAALDPYVNQLGALQRRCRPFGRDYLALEIPRQCIGTTAYHFTKMKSFFGAKADSAGPIGEQR
jgi:hypothetical protein